MPRRLFLFFLILSLLPAPALAGKGACTDAFGRIAAHLRGPVKDPLKELARLEQVTVKDLFPDSKSILRTRKTRTSNILAVKVTEANRLRYQEVFDQIWDARVGAGQVPQFEVDAYRAWLKAKSADGVPFPEVDPRLLYEEYYADGGTMMEYFDLQFLNYLYETKKVTADTVDEYLSTVDRSLLKHYARSTIRWTKSGSKVFLGAGTLAFTAYFITISGDVVNTALNGLWESFLGRTLKDLFIEKTKEGTTFVTDQVKSSWDSFTGGEDGFVQALANLSAALRRFERVKFGQKTRPEATQAIEKFTKSTATQLPLFWKKVLSEQKDFETVWDKRLYDLRDALLPADLVYQTHRARVAEIEQKIEASEDPPTGADLEELTERSQQMKNHELFLANALADWLFYKQARGPEKPIDRALDRIYSLTYDNYLLTMDQGLLAEQIGKRVQAYVDNLKKFTTKNVDEVKESGSEEVKPEALIGPEASPIEENPPEQARERFKMNR